MYRDLLLRMRRQCVPLRAWGRGYGFPDRDRLVSDVDFPDGFTVVLIPEMN